MLYTNHAPFYLMSFQDSNLFENLVMFPPSTFLDLSLARLLGLTDAPLSLGEYREGVDASLFLESNKLLA